MLLYNTKDPDRIINLDNFSKITIDKCSYNTYYNCYAKCQILGDGTRIAVFEGKDSEEQARKILKQIKDGYDNSSTSITITADINW